MFLTKGDEVEEGEIQKIMENSADAAEAVEVPSDKIKNVEHEGEIGEST